MLSSEVNRGLSAHLLVHYQQGTTRENRPEIGRQVAAVH
jgi:hypothetical protein